MKLFSLLSIMALLMTPVTAIASQNAGKAFGAGVQCTLSDGTVKSMPRDMCRIYGGESQ